MSPVHISANISNGARAATRNLVPALVLLFLTGLAVILALAGRATASGTRRQPADEQGQAVPDGLALLYRFTGVADDGQQGQSGRAEATSVHCTNVGSASAQVEVLVFAADGVTEYSGAVIISPNQTFTFSTQNTAIFFDDVLLGGAPGTGAIDQGSGQIFGSHGHVICTAQVLDPGSQTPAFMDKLDLFTPDGYPIGGTRRIYLPNVQRN